MSDSPVAQVDLLDMFCVATSGIAAYRVFAAAKVKSIEMWAPAQAGNVTTVSIQWLGTGPISGPKSTVSDTTLGATRPAHVHSLAPKDAVASMWFADSSTGGTLFLLTGPQNTVVDIVISLTLRNDEAAVAVSAAVAAATTGRVYCRRMDSVSASILVPVSLDTI